LDSDVQNKIISLWKEYNECKTNEAKLAKALDKLEVLMQHNEADKVNLTHKEWEFNLIYGKEFTDFHSFIKEFRKIIDKQTIEKVKNG